MSDMAIGLLIGGGLTILGFLFGAVFTIACFKQALQTAKERWQMEVSERIAQQEPQKTGRKTMWG